MNQGSLELFPQTEQEFYERFATEKACRDYFIKLRWPGGFVCAKCGHNESWSTQTRELWICTNCQCQASLRAGTILEHSKSSYQTWLLIMHHVTASKQGISSLELSRRIGISLKQSFYTLRKLRGVMGQTAQCLEPLSGTIYLDATVVKTQSISNSKKTTSVRVASAVEHRRRKSGRARLILLDHNRPVGVSDFSPYILPDCKIRYSKQNNEDRRDLILKLFLRVIVGTHQCSVSKEHLQDYLNEYCFRFNMRDSKDRFALFKTLSAKAMDVTPRSSDHFSHNS